MQICDGQVREKDAVIATVEQEIHQLEQVTQEKDRDIDAREKQLQMLNKKLEALQQVTQEKDDALEAREKRLRELNKKLEASEQVTAQLQQNLKKLQEENHLCQELDKDLIQHIVTQKGKLTHSCNS